MGAPKQLLRYRGQSLLRRAAGTAVKTKSERVVVVVGRDAQQMRDELAGLPVSVVENADWHTGMGSSIRSGMAALEKDDLDGVVLMLCDQPFVTARTLKKLVTTHLKTGKPIVASVYENTKGVPAFFSRELFEELKSLTADEGARRVIVAHPQSVATVAFAQGAFDVDTPHEYELLRTRI